MVVFRTLSFAATSPLVAGLMTRHHPIPLEVQLDGAGPWAGLKHLLNAALPVRDIVAFVRQLNRVEALQLLAKITADLANGENGIVDQSRRWTNDLLVQHRDSSNPLAAEIADAVSYLEPRMPIAHAQVAYVLQQLVLAEGSATGRRPQEEELALLMLALNDHLPIWETEETLSSTEYVAASQAFASVFNRTSDDPLRFLCRLQSILTQPIEHAPISSETWSQIVHAALGCSVQDYVRLYVAPLCILARGWGNSREAVLNLQPWWQGRHGALHRRWFAEASLPLEEAQQRLCSVRSQTGLPLLNRDFYRTPFLLRGDSVLCLSPWHLFDHLSLGTWAKLNLAAKQVLRSGANQKFTATFGYMFESWCAGLARRASVELAIPDLLLLPSHPGAEDEIEDVVFVSGNSVVLISAKSSLIPESSLKTARKLRDVLDWHERFFFGEANAGYRAGALRLLDKKIRRIRSGEYEHRGIRRDAEVVPAVVTFDHLADGYVMDAWLDERCQQEGLLPSRDSVLPVTLLSPENYEALLRLAPMCGGVCRLLSLKASSRSRLTPVDWFFKEQADSVNVKNYRLPWLLQEFDDITTASLDYLKEILPAGTALMKSSAEQPDE